METKTFINTVKTIQVTEIENFVKASELMLNGKLLVVNVNESLIKRQINIEFLFAGERSFTCEKNIDVDKFDSEIKAVLKGVLAELLAL